MDARCSVRQAHKNLFSHIFDTASRGRGRFESAAPGANAVAVVERHAGLAAEQATLGSVAVRTTPALMVNGAPPGVYAVRVRALSAAGSGPPSRDAAVAVP